MPEARDNPAENIQIVERFLAAFNGRWPTKEQLAALVAPEVVFIERPNLLNLSGASATPQRCAPEERGRELLAWQRYEIRDHLAATNAGPEGNVSEVPP